MIFDEEPPLKRGYEKTKVKKGTAFQRILTKLGKQLKIKNQLNRKEQFLALWSKSMKIETLTKAVHGAANKITYAKNFIVERNLIPHFIVVILGLIVALCNVLAARGAGDLYNLIPADPSSQVDIAGSIDRFTPLIASDSALVEKLVTLPTDSGSGSFAIDVKTTSTEKTQRPENQVAAGPRNKTINYVVEPGDTLSGLGMRYNLKTSSIKFVNNITNIDIIKPGTTIKIPPVGYEPSAKEIAAKETKLAQANRNTTTRNISSTRNISVNTKGGSKFNGYPYGYCTYYVAVKRSVPTSWGNAGQWLSSAKRAGYSIGSEPVPGAIVITSESWWGHVAYVESVNGNSFTVTEMNYNGWGVTSSRTMSAGDGAIKGFVY